MYFVCHEIFSLIAPSGQVGDLTKAKRVKQKLMLLKIYVPAQNRVEVITENYVPLWWDIIVL